ncbi:hypothetical protein ACSAZK_17070 [Methanosarcina sp. Mfa9]|uniref:hypothetical protein n=1 Tax=Methanosarcina sp. Mfa9 TaxID=3439063 RepID=UPI003F876F29
MKRKMEFGLVILIILFSLLALPAGAENEDSGFRVTSSGNAFGGGDDLVIDENIEGDLVLAGSRLDVKGDVGDDFTGAGGMIIVNGDVSGNVIALGGSIRVNGNVGGDFVAAGGEISLSEDSTVEGDVLLAGGEVTLDGVINGDGSISTGTLRTGENFELKGNLELNAENVPPDLEENVGGSLTVIERAETDDFVEEAAEGFGLFGFIVGLISSLALGLVLIYLFRDFVAGLAETVRESALKAGLLGLVMLLLLPIMSLLLLFTIFGWSLSVLLALLTTLALLVATVPVKLLAGELIYERVFKKEAGELMYYLIGAVVFAIVYEIPYLGGLVQFVALLLGFGAIGVWFAESGMKRGY